MANEKCGCEGLQDNKSKINELRTGNGCGCEPETVKETKKEEKTENSCGCGSESKKE
jgi:hypothetical protein